MGRIYFALLRAIEARRFRVFGGRVTVPDAPEARHRASLLGQARWGDAAGGRSAAS